MTKKLIPLVVSLAIATLVIIWNFAIVRQPKQSLCGPGEVLACCSLYYDDICYITKEDTCLTEYNIKCVPRHNNYPVMEPQP